MKLAKSMRLKAAFAITAATAEIAISGALRMNFLP